MAAVLYTAPPQQAQHKLSTVRVHAVLDNVTQVPKGASRTLAAISLLTGLAHGEASTSAGEWAPVEFGKNLRERPSLKGCALAESSYRFEIHISSPIVC